MVNTKLNNETENSLTFDLHMALRFTFDLSMALTSFVDYEYFIEKRQGKRIDDSYPYFQIYN